MKTAMSFTEAEYRHTLRFPDDDAASFAPARSALHFIGCDGPHEVDCFVMRAVLELLEGGVLDAGASTRFGSTARQYAKFGRNPQGNITVTLADL